MLRKILEKNRGFLRYVTVWIFPTGCLLFIVFGISIIAKGFPDIDVSGYPVWQGFFLFYTGFALLLMYIVDMIYSLLGNIFSDISRYRKKSTLSERIEREGRGL